MHHRRALSCRYINQRKGTEMKKAIVIAGVMVAMGGTLAAEVLAQEKPENYIRLRKSNQQVVNWHMRQLQRMIKSDKVDAAQAARAANVVATLAPVFASAFPPGTDQGDTRARPEIWTQREKFDEYMNRFVSESAKLAEATKGGGDWKGQFGTLAKVCDSCHDDFRKK
jgi:cytochrome c556